MPRDVEAFTSSAVKSESVSVDVPLVIQFPKSTTIVPLPTLVVGELNPENSNVCDVAN